MSQNAPKPPTPERMERIRKIITSTVRGEIRIRVVNGGIIAIVREEVFDGEHLDEL